MGAAFDLLVRETALFAAAGFLLLGTGDLALDLIWIVRTAKRRLTVYRHHPPATALSLALPENPGRMAILVPAWDEASVIGGMLRHALEAIDHGDYLVLVGCYPNEPATIAAVRQVDDPRVRAVLCDAPGPTTKASCLNCLWEAVRAEEAAAGRRFKAVVLHDAEDVVPALGLRIFDSLVERFDLVQLPVRPLIDPGSRWVSATYADEFAEAHGKELVVREALGAAVPSAGVGCAVARDALDRLADLHGAPFDSDSLTEDYELGIRLRHCGGRAAFVRLPTGPGAPPAATRAYFPRTFTAAVAQKARWMQGIALSGWDRLGWSGGLAERWMRMRDRQSLLAALILAAGYLAMLLWLLRAGATLAGAPPIEIGSTLRSLLLINAGMLGWRLAMRFGFVAQTYGWGEGLRSIPRALVGNLIAMLAARQAVMRYASPRETGWDKTAHAFPAAVPAE